MIYVVNATGIATTLGKMFKGLVMRLGLNGAMQINFDALALMVEMVHKNAYGNYTGTLYGVTEANKFIVPAGERWYLNEVELDVLTVDSKGFRIAVKGVEYTIYAAIPNNHYTNLDLQGWVLDEGDWVCLQNSGDAGDSTRFMHLSYQRLKLNN